MKRVLVAGATGYLGGFVAREFKERGYPVRVLVRSAERLGALRKIVDEVVVAEITRPDTLKGVCDGMDIVFSSVGITKQKDGAHLPGRRLPWESEPLDVGPPRRGPEVRLRVGLPGPETSSTWTS